MSETKIVGLSRANVTALEEVASHLCDTTATTATFYGPVETNVTELQRIIRNLPGRGHPKASLHAVVRKLCKQIPPIADDDPRARSLRGEA